MRMVPRISLVCLLVFVILAPASAFSGQLPANLERAILPGTTHISYAGQSFVFQTTVPLHVKFVAKTLTKIELSVSPRATRDGAGGGSSPQAEDQLQIQWLDWNNELYSGSPPEDPWVTILDTESGYTEK